MKLYRVQLVGGPADGSESVCSGNVVMWSDGDKMHRYERREDDRYHYAPACTS